MGDHAHIWNEIPNCCWKKVVRSFLPNSQRLRGSSPDWHPHTSAFHNADFNDRQVSSHVFQHTHISDVAPGDTKDLFPLAQGRLVPSNWKYFHFTCTELRGRVIVGWESQLENRASRICHYHTFSNLPIWVWSGERNRGHWKVHDSS